MTARRGALLAAIVLATAHGAHATPLLVTDSPSHTLVIRPSAVEIEFGAAFELVVESRHGPGVSPAPFDERTLAPLHLERLEVAKFDGGETIRYRARSFRGGEIAIPAVERGAARRGIVDPALAARSEELRITVRSALAPEHGAEIEYPELMALPPRGDDPLGAQSVRLVLLLALFALAFVLMRIALRRRAEQARIGPAPPAESPASVSPATVALERLAALRSAAAAAGEWDDDAVLASVDAASWIVRDYLGARYRLRAGEMTSEQLATADAIAESTRERLAPWFAVCDLGKFARRAPRGDRHGEFLAQAETIVTRDAEAS
jgi:hypothetical protein